MTTNKDLTIHLKIQTVRIPVSKRMPVIVIWSRHNKKINTKKRLLTDTVDTANWNEEFQISTIIPCNEAGEPTKPKMSILTVAGPKDVGILGKADLDLA